MWGITYSTSLLSFMYLWCNWHNLVNHNGNKMNLGVRTVKGIENFVYSNSLLHLNVFDNVLDHVLIMSEVWVVLITKLPMTLSRLIFRIYLIIFTFRFFSIVGSCLTKFLDCWDLDWLGFQMLLWRRFSHLLDHLESRHFHGQQENWKTTALVYLHHLHPQMFKTGCCKLLQSMNPNHLKLKFRIHHLNQWLH